MHVSANVKEIYCQYTVDSFNRLNFQLRGLIPIMAYLERLPPKGVQFFRLQVYEKVEISSIRKSKEICDFGP